jgi:hypothetical protein
VSWRYLAQKLTGDGAGEWLDTDVPLADVQLTDSLSGPPALSAKLSPEQSRLFDSSGKPLFGDWSTAFYAEADGQIRLGAILTRSQWQGADWSLECTGFSGYPVGMPYTDSWYGVEIDALDVVRHIWDHLQSKAGGDIGVVVDPLMSGVKIGTELTQDEFDTQNGDLTFESGPIQLNWYSTDDLGKQIDDLAASTPFDWHEEHSWSGDNVTHRIRLAFPRMGRRRDDLRFVIGENVMVLPSVSTSGEDFANQVLGLGNGEGRDMVHGLVAANDGRLRRVAVETDKSRMTAKDVTAFARRQLGIRQGVLDVTELVARNHPHAPIGSWSVGDEIRLMGRVGWIDVDLWVRVTSYTIDPAASDNATLTVLRSDKIGTT